MLRYTTWSKNKILKNPRKIAKFCIGIGKNECRREGCHRHQNTKKIAGNLVPVLKTPKLEFTVVCLQILVWIYVNAIHSRVLILDLPANIDF
jgi:hypothetical protein